MSSFPYCQQLLCRQPQIDPMGLKGTYSKINHLTRSYITYLGLKSHGCTPKSHFFRPLLLSGGVLKLSRNQDSMETEKEWEVLISTEGFNQDVWLLSIRLSDPMHFVPSACNHIAGIMQIQVYTETKHECCILLYCHEFNRIHDIFWCSLVIGTKNPLWLT